MAVRAVPELIGRLAGFATSIAFTTVVGLFAIPILVNTAGAETWAVIALAQSIALLWGVAVSFGWGTTGPAMVAGMPPSDRPQMYMDSVVSRAYLFAMTLPLTMLVVSLVVHHDRMLTALACVAYVLPFLGGAWFFVGDAQPRRLFLFDTLPQSLGVVAGLIGLVLTRNMFVFVMALMVFNTWTVITTAFQISVRAPDRPLLDLRFKAAMLRLSGQRHGVITAATSSLYVNTPLIAVSAIIPGGLAVYAMGDKFFRYSLTALGPVIQVLQGWIPDPVRSTRDRRIRRTMRIAPLAGLVGGVAIAVFAPWAAALLSGGRIVLGYVLTVPFGTIFFGVAISQMVGLACLIPIGRGASLVKSTALGAFLGIPMILIGAFVWGVVGVAWAVAVSEVVVALYQLRILAIHFR
ncbi:MAG: hypothetical protein M3Z35_07095, partial [Nitrospirota bacterium]|nr:hypothetical protein [Nitrospirota bacterium]